MTITGIVQKGQQRGKKMGFPTVNFPLVSPLPEGIYVSHIIIEGTQYNALTFIGAAKTFDEKVPQAETYVFDFNKDIYGKEVEVTLLKKIRDNQKFVSVETLVAQMEDDKRKALEYFKKI